MKRPSFAAGFALAGLIVMGITRPISAGEMVPFKGVLEGVVSHESIDAQTDFVLVEASGTATQLGAFAVSVPHLVNTPTRTAAGDYEFTAANGDTLIASFTGQASPTATPGVISIVETATIDPDRSTGRFAGARGSFVVTRLYDRIADTTIGSFVGKITSPGANNP